MHFVTFITPRWGQRKVLAILSHLFWFHFFLLPFFVIFSFACWKLNSLVKSFLFLPFHNVRRLYKYKDLIVRMFMIGTKKLYIVKCRCWYENEITSQIVKLQLFVSYLNVSNASSHSWYVNICIIIFICHCFVVALIIIHVYHLLY